MMGQSTFLVGLIVGILFVHGVVGVDPVPGWNNTNDLGQSAEFKYGSLEFFKKSMVTFKSPEIFKAFVDGFEQVHVFNCDEVSRLLVGEHDLVEIRWPNTLRALIGDGSLLMTKGRLLWYRGRTQIEASVSPEQVESFVPLIQQRVADVVSKWEFSSAPLNLYQETRNVIFDAMVTVLFGKIFTDEEYATYHTLYSTLEEGVLTTTFDSPLTTWGKALRANKRIRAFFTVLILEKIDDLRDGKPKNEPSVIGKHIQTILDDGVDLEDVNVNDLVDVACAFFFASHGVSSQAVARVMWELPTIPNFLAKIVTEQSGILGHYGKTLTLEALNFMPYLDAVIKEAFRVQPPVPAVYRQSLKDQEVAGKLIKKGQIVIVFIAASCNNPKYFQNTKVEDIATFNPDRWLGDLSGGCPAQVEIPARMMPFGGGTRQCPGRYLATTVMKTILSLATRKGYWTRTFVPEKYVYPETAKLATVTYKRKGAASAIRTVCSGMSMWPSRPGDIPAADTHTAQYCPYHAEKAQAAA